MKPRYALKTIVFVVVFVTMAYVANYMSGGNVSAAYAEMQNSTLPVAYVEYNGRLINSLHGYKNEIDMTLLRDAVTSLTKEKTITIWVENNKTTYDNVDYEVRSMDGSLIEKGAIENCKDEIGYLKCTTSIRMDLKAGEEYYFILILSDEEESVRYYSRIMVEEDSHVMELLSFVEEFHNETFIKNEEESMIPARIEPNDTGNNDDLSHVSIHSSYDTITYGGMAPQPVSQVIPTVQEIHDDYVVFSMSFVIAAGDETITNYYNVTENYKVGVDEEGTPYLKDYQRTQEELYNYKSVNTTKNWFKIGVANDDTFSYVTSDDEEKVAFVRQGQLWYYDYNRTSIVRVFGFWQEDYLDVNNTYRQHDIQILSLDDEGNVAFAVSGYMNRGNHEGHTGIAVYRYWANTHRTEEIMFVETKLPYEQQSVYTKRFMYLNDKNTFFYLLQDKVYRVTAAGDISVLAENVSLADFAVAKDYSKIAYAANQDIAENQEMVMMDLTMELTTTYSVGGEDRLRPLGFVDYDVVCGRAKASDMIEYEDGTLVFPMYVVEVLNMDKELQKEYQESGVYIMGTQIDGYDIFFDRAKKQGNVYEDIGQDFITYKELDEANRIVTEYRYSATSLNLLYMIFPDYIYVKSIPRLIITKESVEDNSVMVIMDKADRLEQYYVFNTGGLTATYASATQALKDAYENQGIVMNQNGTQIWENAAIPDYFTVNDEIEIVQSEGTVGSLVACMKMMMEHGGVHVEMEELASYEGDVEKLFDEKLQKTGVQLVDVPVDIMLYYLSNGIPLITKLNGDHYVLLTSYNAVALRYIDPVTGESIKVDREELEKKLEAQGNQFITYVP